MLDLLVSMTFRAETTFLNIIVGTTDVKNIGTKVFETAAATWVRRNFFWKWSGRAKDHYYVYMRGNYVGTRNKR